MTFVIPRLFLLRHYGTQIFPLLMQLCLVLINNLPPYSITILISYFHTINTMIIASDSCLSLSMYTVYNGAIKQRDCDNISMKI